MPSHAERRYAAYAPAQIYELVADVESYPAFLPWCTDCRIYSRADNVLHARLGVGFKVIRESFRSRVTLDPIERIDIAYLDGPFRHLDSRWKFSPKDDGCLIDFFIDFEFRSLLLRKIMGPLFNEVVRRSVGAFVARADALYGPGRAGGAPARRAVPAAQK
ncbi:MAG: type II toxin-antitoxin system RatA family toxin [Defluviicoccus sp.]|nr:type II toxin-antitoxin system RatA family toxin [Defluviicoccus sp.]MDE0385263.1 type II toxin-antitoxin system RatA family toxin [Defluviicoccus sp.]